jgi:hypothetical protein
MYIHRVYDYFFRWFRPRRVRKLYRVMDISPESMVLDVGGTVSFWRMAVGIGLPLPRVTLVNIIPPTVALLAGMRSYQMDATALAFPDRSFDIAVSNSVIEHVRDKERFASEIDRVADRYFVQTPDRRFPIEPHYMAPFVHWLSPAARMAVLPYTPWALIARPQEAEIRASVQEIELLGRREMSDLFPGAKIISERFLGISKALVAIRCN